jgi:uncharacterized protein (DUF1697 family)
VTAYAALLRGINVGGNKKVSMPELKALFVDLGFADVATYIQSGNVVFRAPKADARAIEERITKVFGHEVTVVLRTRAELAAAVKGNPFVSPKANLKQLYVVYLDRKPAAGAEKQLDPDRSPGDRFKLHGQELYLDLGNGAGRTKLTLDYLERKLGVKGTARNWNTALKLVELSSP